MYSALKINGRKLYELAREGKVVERKARRVEIYDIEILEINLPRIHMRVHCSKGTYIRTLCYDIGRKLGCGACMESLLRTKAGVFLLENSHTLAEIEEKSERNELEEFVIPVDKMFASYKNGIVEEEWKKLAYNGHSLPEEAVCTESLPEEDEKVKLYDREKHFVGIYQYTKEKEYKIIKMFYVTEGN